MWQKRQYELICWGKILDQQKNRHIVRGRRAGNVKGIITNPKGTEDLGEQEEMVPAQLRLDHLLLVFFSFL